MKIFSITIILTIACVSCQPEHATKENPSAEKEVQPRTENKPASNAEKPQIQITWLNDSVYQYEVEIREGDMHATMLTTCQDDSVDTAERALFKPVYLEQVFSIYIRDSLMAKVKNPGRAIRQKLERGTYANMLDNFIFSVEIVKGEKGLFYALEAYGGCNAACPGLEMYISKEGKMLFLDYGTEDEVYLRKGSRDKMEAYLGAELIRCSDYAIRGVSTGLPQKVDLKH